MQQALVDIPSFNLGMKISLTDKVKALFILMGPQLSDLRFHLTTIL